MDHTISQRNFFISIPKFQIIQFTHRIFIFKRQKGKKKKKKGQILGKRLFWNFFFIIQRPSICAYVVGLF